MIRRLQITTFDATDLANLIDSNGGIIVTATNGGHFDGVGSWQTDDTVVIWFHADANAYLRIADRLSMFKRQPKEV